jgi:hypothetical protein
MNLNLPTTNYLKKLYNPPRKVVFMVDGWFMWKTVYRGNISIIIA